MEHFLPSFVLCFVAISVISFRQAFVRRSLKEVDCIVDSFSPKLDRCLGVNHLSSSLLGDGTDHSLSDTVLVVSVRQKRFICCAAGSKHRAEGLVIVLSSALIASESFDLISLAHSMDSGLNGLVGGGACFRLLIWEHPYECEADIVINE